MKSLENNELRLAAAATTTVMMSDYEVEKLCQVVTNDNGHW